MLVKDLKEFLKDVSDDKEIYFENLYKDNWDNMYSIKDVYIDDDGDIVLNPE